jgi:hypothetical protein
VSDQDTGVRAWVDLLARIRFGTQTANGRELSSTTIKAVAGRLAAYADFTTGARIRPGVARLAVDLETDVKTVKAGLAVLRRVGLLRLVATGGRSGAADRYQLTIPVDLLDREDIEVWSPARHDLEIDRIRRRDRGRTTRPTPPDAGPDGARTTPEMQAPKGPAKPVDNQRSQAPTGPAQPPAAPKNEGPVSTARTGNAGPVSTEMQAPSGPAITQGSTTTTTTQPQRDLRTKVAVPRARAPVIQDQILEVEQLAQPPPTLGPTRCPEHNLAAGTRPDGQPRCPVCRALNRTRPPTLRVIPGGAA